ncbi:hypothetical protein O6H91_Y085500 [Diphasiastrum complanatum]|nr:hypothetical protein O6H91_Y085500 [Diphasiastrum complanatum]
MDAGTAVLSANGFSPPYFHLNSSSLSVAKTPTHAVPFPFEAASIDLTPPQTASSSFQQRKPEGASDPALEFLRHAGPDYSAMTASKNSRSSVSLSAPVSEIAPASVAHMGADSMLWFSAATDPSTSPGFITAAPVQFSPPLSPLPIASLSTSTSLSPLSSPFLIQSLDPSPLPSPPAISPTSSEFVSAYTSPFLSPYSSSTCSTSFVTPPSEPLNPVSLQAADQESEYYQSNVNPLSELTQFQSIDVSPDRNNIRHASDQPQTVNGNEFKVNSAQTMAQEKTSSAPSLGNETAAYFTGFLSEIVLPGPSLSFSPAQHSTPILQRISSNPASNWLRNCDVFIGMCGQSTDLLRFSKWLQAELELQGIACFTADRSRYSDSRSHDIARRIIHTATFGVIVVSRRTFKNPWSIEEVRIFSEKKNLVPIFFDLAPSDCIAKDIIDKKSSIWENDGGELWRLYDGGEEEWRETVEEIGKVEDWGLQASNGGSRNCILKAVNLLAMKLGRSSPVRGDGAAGKEGFVEQELPFPRNTYFTGREKELRSLESMLFARGDEDATEARDDRERQRSNKLPTHRESDSERKLEGKSVEIEESETRKSELTDERSEELSASATSWDAQKEGGTAKGSKPIRSRDARRGRHAKNKYQRRRAQNGKEKSAGDKDPSSSYGSVACITGVSGVGKTDLALEYAYRNAQQYRCILWIAGEARYLRQSYVNLSSCLNIKPVVESQAGIDHGQMRNFDEREAEAMERVKRELSRDVPYLLIIDNLEMERDWWDGREILDLLPPAGGASHVIITTRLSQVLRFRHLELSAITRLEALSLMKADGRDYSPEEKAALEQIDDKLGRHTLGLWIVRHILKETPLLPSQLLANLTAQASINLADTIFEGFPYLLKLLQFCFDLLDQADGPKKLATKMASVAGWLAPLPVSLELLSVAASKLRTNPTGLQVWRNRTWQMMTCGCLGSRSRAAGGELLARFGLARRTTRDGWVQIHEIIQLYARKKATTAAAKAAVQGVRKKGLLPMESWGHAWAASFLLFGFGTAESVTIELKAVDLISFIEKVALPLALHSFTCLSFCHASVELLHLCAKKLEDIEQSFSSKGDGCARSLCWSFLKNGLCLGNQIDELVWQDVTLLKALLLETQAKLLLKGGQFDAGEEVCRTCISIRTVMLGENHPDTLAAQEILARLITLRTSS